MRKLAEKHGVKENAILTKARREEWNEQRKHVEHKVNTKRTQKIVEKVVAQNLTDAQIAIQTRSILLRKCMQEAQALAESDGTEARTTETVRTKDGDKVITKDVMKARKLRDLAETIKTLMDISTLATMAETDDSFEKAMSTATAEAWKDGDDVPV